MRDVGEGGVHVEGVDAAARSDVGRHASQALSYVREEGVADAGGGAVEVLVHINLGGGRVGKGERTGKRRGSGDPQDGTKGEEACDRLTGICCRR